MNTRTLVAIALAATLFACDETPTSGETDSSVTDAETDSTTGRDLGTDDTDDGDTADVEDPEDADDTGPDAEPDSEPGDTGGDAGTDPDTSEADAEPDALTDTVEETTPDAPPTPDATEDAETIDGAGEYEPDTDGVVDRELCPPESEVPPGCVAEHDEGEMDRCDGFDNDCDGVIDENCTCKVGEVQDCFQGPPGRVDVGACAPGTQVCVTGADGEEVWGACEGGISPSAEVCDSLDNDCNGCTDELIGCDPDLFCPAPGDPRIPDGTPFADYELRGGEFYTGDAIGWNWSIVGGPCDDIVPGRRSFDLTGATSENATFTPRLSGSYTVTMRVTTVDGFFECTWVIHVIGPGLRIEMCYPESMTQDLDLLAMHTRFSDNWYPFGGNAFSPNFRACSWWNCEASLRGAPERTDWAYPNTDISECEGGPQGDQWRALGYCANPRLDIDNNLVEGVGLPENINVDNPNNRDQFRVMVQNFSGTIARPIVNIYCGGRRAATFGAAPDTVPVFTGASGSFSVGAMWRVADVRVVVDEDGVTTDCEVTPIHPPGASSGYRVTYDDPSW